MDDNKYDGSKHLEGQGCCQQQRSYLHLRMMITYFICVTRCARKVKNNNNNNKDVNFLKSFSCFHLPLSQLNVLSIFDRSSGWQINPLSHVIRNWHRHVGASK